jgi:hypothetical protein
MKPQHPHFKPRTIKLSYLCYPNPDPFNRTPPKTVPFLRLSGLWLTAAGFHPGQHCKVTVANGALLITAEPPAPEPPAKPKRKRRH